MKRFAIGLVALGLIGIVPARADAATVQRDVAFEVVNENRSVTFCPTDGGTYTVRGAMAAPARGAGDAVTLYIHGGGDLNSWNLKSFPRFDFIDHMARRGHTSVFLHSLGYGPSDPVDGNQVCFGSYATIIDQVIRHLRAGTYTTDGPSRAFGRVALVGHSGGAIAVEVYSVSFDGADAFGIVGWADTVPLMPSFATALVVPLGMDCANGGRSKQPDGPAGWGTGPYEEFIRDVTFNVREEIVQAIIQRWAVEGDPCGASSDVGAAIAASTALAHTVTVPILLLYGDHDLPYTGAQLDIQRRRYTASGDVSLAVLPDTGHAMMVGNTFRTVVESMSGWLRARGF